MLSFKHILIVCWIAFIITCLAEVDNLSDDTCLKLLKKFANSSAAYTFCTISHARPILVCQKCVSTYLEVVRTYDEITKKAESFGHDCARDLVNLDRLEVFQEGYNYINNLWNTAKCDGCFIKNATTGHPSTKQTDVVVEILNASVELQSCISKHHNTSVNPDLEVCKQCDGSYKIMNDVFNKNKGSFCMDIVDLLNRTRNDWSKVIGCCLDREKPETTLILAAIGIGALPLIFYLTIYMVSTKQDDSLIERTRWKSTGYDDEELLIPNRRSSTYGSIRC